MRTMTNSKLYILGASARAAAFSALRAGMTPVCVDLFADRDLAQLCDVTAVSSTDYPRSLGARLGKSSSPWIYVGGLENYPRLIDKWSELQPLWGNPADVLRKARDPRFLSELYEVADIPHPRTVPLGEAPDLDGRWLIKPRCGAGGAGIAFLDQDQITSRMRRTHFAQEYLEGESCSAIYVGHEDQAQLLGATRQLVGETWLNAVPFSWCGNVGPLTLDDSTEELLKRLGNLLVNEIGLRGLFGVDFILRDEIPMPVEVNPRYVASVEVLEVATGLRALHEHRRAFESDHVRVPSHSHDATKIVGKAILFAREDLTFPDAGPWLDSLRLEDIHQMPDFADIPNPGSIINKGWPILTFFAQTESACTCIHNLQQQAEHLDILLHER